jgi:ABC-type dipeptide/oligopeptide/nickel transport system permease subunit
LRRAAIWIPSLWLILGFGSALVALALGQDATLHDLARSLQPGRDAFGRDVLSLTLRASLSSGGFALAVALVSSGVGIAAGSFLALAGGRTRFAFARANELLLAFPSLLLALAWASIRGSSSAASPARSRSVPAATARSSAASVIRAR